MVSQVMDMLNQTDGGADIQERTEELIAVFKDRPRQTAAALILAQEMCIERGVLPGANVLDSDDDVTGLIDQLEPEQQRIILI